MNYPQTSKLRTLLILGRVSNLPTVWSNCLAGWILAGGGRWALLVWAAFFVSLLYIGGMFLNDAFDAEFDLQHRSNRPIPSGAISEKGVWVWGLIFMLAGAAGLVGLGSRTGLLGAGLVFFILLYNTVHKFVAIGPGLMGACRFFVYLVAASVGLFGVTGETVWKAVGLASYIVGLSCVARKESARVKINYWPLFFLAAPLILAWLFEDTPAAGATILISALFILWTGFSIFPLLTRAEPNVRRTVSFLLAGIALADALAAGAGNHLLLPIFFLLFLLALAGQRFIPAT